MYTCPLTEGACSQYTLSVDSSMIAPGTGTKKKFFFFRLPIYFFFFKGAGNSIAINDQLNNIVVGAFSGTTWSNPTTNTIVAAYNVYCGLGNGAFDNILCPVTFCTNNVYLIFIFILNPCRSCNRVLYPI